MPAQHRSSSPKRITFLVWRDLSHPDGGGSELFVERVARYLARQGWQATICCAAHAGAEPDEDVEGVHLRRRGGRLTVYLRGLAYLVSAAGRRSDLVVDVQNGIPFFSPLVRRRRTLVLVHHLHREQWRIIYPGPTGRIGWWIESRLGPLLYRRSRYVTVSHASRRDLVSVGVDAERIDIVGNGIDVPHPIDEHRRASNPTICVLGRLVPHKQVEHVIGIAAKLRQTMPDLRVDVIGDGWWHDELRDLCERTGTSAIVRLHGRVDESTKHHLLEQAWILVHPSVKEGWGIAILEAAAHGVPALAYRSAGGVCDAIVDGVTGVLVADEHELGERVECLLRDPETRLKLGHAAHARAGTFSWDNTGAAFASVADRVMAQD